MTDQADLPQDLLDPECPDCGRILAAPPYTRLSSPAPAQGEVGEAAKWRKAFTVQSNKLQAVLHIAGVREALEALHPQQEAQARPELMRVLSQVEADLDKRGQPNSAKIIRQAMDTLTAPQGERETLERAARVAEQAEEIGPRGYRFETGTLRRIIAAAIRGLAPAPQWEECHACGVAAYERGYGCHNCDFNVADLERDAPQAPDMNEVMRQSLAYMRLFTAVRAWMRIRGVGWDSLAAREVKDAMNAIDRLSTRPQEGK